MVGRGSLGSRTRQNSEKNQKKYRTKLMQFLDVESNHFYIWLSSHFIIHFFQNKEEQIVGTQEKSQWIVAQRLLSHLQYLDATKSSAKDLSFLRVNLWLVGSNFWR